MIEDEFTEAYDQMKFGSDENELSNNILEEKNDFKKNKKILNDMLKSVIDQNASANKFEIEFLEVEFSGVKKPGIRVIARANGKIVDIREMAEK